MPALKYKVELRESERRQLFIFCEPKGGWRHFEVTERRTAVDFAHQMRWLLDEVYPDTIESTYAVKPCLATPELCTATPYSPLH